VDIPVDDFWQISGIFGGSRGDVHRLRGREEIAKTLVVQGFSSLFVLVIPCLRSLPKLDVADSTPVARSTFSPTKINGCDDPRAAAPVLEGPDSAIFWQMTSHDSFLRDPYYTNAMRLRA
jgi:hypothetical protein